MVYHDKLHKHLVKPNSAEENAMGSYGRRIQFLPEASDRNRFERLQKDEENDHKILKLF